MEKQGITGSALGRGKNSRFLRFIQGAVLSRFRLGSFGGKVAGLAGATALAQAVSLVVSPLLTRLYDPADFGLVATMNAIVGLFAIIATLRTQVAVTVADDDEKARALLEICIMLSLGACGMLCLATWAFRGGLFSLLNVESAVGFWWFLPAACMGVTLYEAFYYFGLRAGRFQLIGRTRIAQAIVSAILGIGVGLWLDGPLGLLLAGLFLNATGILALCKDSRNRWPHAGEGGRRRRWRSVGKEFFGFCSFGTLAALMNASGLLIPPILMSNLHGTEATGSFSLAFRIVSVPMTVLGGAVSNVFLSEASSIIRRDEGGLFALYRGTLKGLRWPALGIALCSLLWPWIFPLVFGAQWHEAGAMASALGLVMAAQLVVSPLSNVAVVLRRQRLQSVLDLLRSAAVVVSIWYPSYLGVGATGVIVCYAVTMLALYGLYFIVYWTLARRSERAVISVGSGTHG